MKLEILLLSFSIFFLVLALGLLSVRLAKGFNFRVNIKRKKIPANWPALSLKKPSRFQNKLNWSGLDCKFFATKKIFIFFTLGFGLNVVLGIKILLLLILTIFFSIALVLYLAKKRREKFICQLPDSLENIVDALGAGFSLPQAASFVARELEPPIQCAYLALGRAENLSIAFTTALEMISVQLDVPEWTEVAETLIAREKLGGSAGELLAASSKSIRDCLEVDKEVRSLTAAGRMSGFLIAALVPLALLFFLLVSPSYINVMVSTLPGKILLSLALALEIIGFFWIKKVVSVDF